MSAKRNPEAADLGVDDTDPTIKAINAVPSLPLTANEPAVHSRSAVYGSSTSGRSRRTKAQLSAIDDAILECLLEEHPASLRGTFYRVVSMGAVDKTVADYRLVGRQVLKLRRAGVLPYSWITDGTRWIVKPRTWSDADEMLDDAVSSYRRALWHSQPVNVHLFTEKDAIVGVINKVTSQYDVPLGVLRGYASETFAWEVAAAVAESEKPSIFYQLGDHDPSGIDAWRNFSEKVQSFASKAEVSFERLAVLPHQILDWDLPTRPTKTTDTRAANFEGGSVEVDAIPPSMLRTIVKEAIEWWIDPHKLELTQLIEESERRGLEAMLAGWSAS